MDVPCKKCGDMCINSDGKELCYQCKPKTCKKCAEFLDYSKKLEDRVFELEEQTGIDKSYIIQYQLQVAEFEKDKETLEAQSLYYAQKCDALKDKLRDAIDKAQKYCDECKTDHELGCTDGCFVAEFIEMLEEVV